MAPEQPVCVAGVGQGFSSMAWACVDVADYAWLGHNSEGRIPVCQGPVAIAVKSSLFTGKAHVYDT